MKDVIKVRSFDSLKKLSHKRAKGKLINISSLSTSTSKAIITLEKLGLLTPELLWELVERLKYLYIEEYKLEWVIRAREKNLSLFAEDVDKYVNIHSDTKIGVLRVPYEIRIIPKYKNYIWSKEIVENK